jgi:hypothetical protein
MAASPAAATGGVSNAAVVAALKASIESTDETARKNAEDLLLDVSFDGRTNTLHGHVGDSFPLNSDRLCMWLFDWSPFRA